LVNVVVVKGGFGLAQAPLTIRPPFEHEDSAFGYTYVYSSYRLSCRDLVEMMAGRGVEVAHSTILRWFTRYVPEFEKRWGDSPSRWVPRGGSTRPTFRSKVVSETIERE